MMKNELLIGCAAAVLIAGAAQAGVSASDAGKLKTTLTPMGGEKAGNADGSIPAWSGGYTAPIADTNDGFAGDPFASEKPLFTITAKNMDQYKDKLTPGVQAMLTKYPDSYRLDIYPTHRTAAAPQWVYDNIFQNATEAKLTESPAGDYPVAFYGPTPFPIPQNGTQAIWNHLLRWRGTTVESHSSNILMTADGKKVLLAGIDITEDYPYLDPKGSRESYGGIFYNSYVLSAEPAVRAGEQIAVRVDLDDDKTAGYVYLTGQRRTRRLPNPCCDTPTPAFAGILSFDELNVFYGRIGRFDWNLVGKKEIYIPYNTNKLLGATSSDQVMDAKHLNPDLLRWELHRVWVVEATIKEGQRHVAPKGTYYLDEDTFAADLGERYDSSGVLWRVLWGNSAVLPSLPATTQTSFGFYDLLSSTWVVGNLGNDRGKKGRYYKIIPRPDPVMFTADGLTSAGIR